MLMYDKLFSFPQAWLITHLPEEKRKSKFSTCPCHKIYRVEAVGLKSSNYALKITIFVNM